MNGIRWIIPCLFSDTVLFILCHSFRHVELKFALMFEQIFESIVSFPNFSKNQALAFWALFVSMTDQKLDTFGQFELVLKILRPDNIENFLEVGLWETTFWQCCPNCVLSVQWNILQSKSFWKSIYQICKKLNKKLSGGDKKLVGTKGFPLWICAKVGANWSPKCGIRRHVVGQMMCPR